jgi:hypothetical protein
VSPPSTATIILAAVAVVSPDPDAARVPESFVEEALPFV